jgi:hypothetical protein
MNHNQIKELIDSTLKDMNMHSEDALELVFLTGLVESGYNYISQIGSGIARSFWQVESPTAKDCIDNYLAFRNSKLELMARIINIDPYTLKELSYDELKHLLWTNIVAGIVFCRIKYWRVPKAIPSDLDGKARYWLKYYNAGGKGTINHFLEMAKTRKD